MKIYNLIVVFLCLSSISFGQCKGDCENGSGKYVFPSGDKYDGEFLDGRFDGKGVYVWIDGTKYDGEWVNGRKEGYGILTNKKPKKIESMISYPHIYNGYFTNGRKDGEGMQSYYDFRKWSGIYKDGEKIKGHYNTENYYEPNDILGNNENCIIQLDGSDSRSYTTIVSFDGINQEFLIDTGASSGFSLPKSFINKLKRAGLKIEFLKVKSQAELADNSKIDIQYAIINGVKIGDYTLNNLVVQYSDNASFLFGTGAFSKFSDWTISGKKGILTLYK